jgi:epsilon-lactone hydrolase
MPSLRAMLVQTLVKYVFAPVTQPGIPLETMRRRYEAALGRGKLPRGIQVEAITVGNVAGEWVSARATVPERVMLYLHGGAYVMGSCATHRLFAAALSRVTGLRVLVLGYRLAPEDPFPAALEDAVAGYRWLLASGFKPTSIVLAGDSAGGGLALSTLVAVRDAGDPLPVAAVLLSPWTDLATSGASYRTRAKSDIVIKLPWALEQRQRYLGNQDARTPLASPLYADLHGFPPLLIHVGSDEMLLDDSTQLAERARQAGVNVTLFVGEGMWHVWHFVAAINPLFPEGKVALDSIGDFVHQQMSALEVSRRPQARA